METYIREAKIEEVRPRELQHRINEGDDIVLIDVRLPSEHMRCRIPGSALMPLHTLAARMFELERDAEVVVYCHHGARSAMAVRMLQIAGFSRVRHLAGGIDAWSVEVDPTTPRY